MEFKNIYCYSEFQENQFQNVELSHETKMSGFDPVESAYKRPLLSTYIDSLLEYYPQFIYARGC